MILLDRLGDLITEATTSCYAWALLRNHVHLLPRTGHAPLPSAHPEMTVS